MAVIALRPEALKRVQALSGIKDDSAFARAVGVSLTTMHRAKNGQGESPRLIAGIAKTFGYSLGEIAVAVDEPIDSPGQEEKDAA